MSSSAEAELFGKISISYTEMNDADQALVIETASNALKTQDKGEQASYHKDIAQIIKQELDKSKGQVFVLYFFCPIYIIF